MLYSSFLLPGGGAWRFDAERGAPPVSEQTAVHVITGRPLPSACCVGEYEMGVKPHPMTDGEDVLVRRDRLSTIPAVPLRACVVCTGTSEEG